MSDLVIHGLPFSTYVRSVLMTCEAKGAPYRIEKPDFRSGAYRELQPFGKMPAMTHGDVHLYETLAIATYVDEAFEGPALQPEGPAARALMLQWISAINAYLYPALFSGCLLQRFIKPMRGMEADEAAIEAAMPNMAQGLDVAEAALSARGFLAGAGPSIADHVLAPILFYLALAPEGRLIEARPALAAWHERMRARPEYAAVNVMPG